MVLGKSDIEEVNEKIGMHIPESTEYDTFSGFILDSIGRIPSEKEQITMGGFVVTVSEKDGNRIREYIIRKVESAEENRQTG